ncbi:MAG: histidine--tRNA ligase [Pirellulaceae bacterium]
MIKPRTLKGFRDFLPESMMPREQLMETARRVYRSFGYAPIDTPALEYLEILTGKGSEETDRQMYHFVDHGDRAVGMRFDLTVPLARFVAQHIEQLGTPFKRYHIGTVWRGEKSQAGRYREFAQCDFDTIGTTSIASDVETVLVIHDLLRAIGFEKFTIRINNRKVLNGLLRKFDLQDKSVEVLRAVDKIDKAGREKVIAELDSCGVDAAQVEQILGLVGIHGNTSQILDQLKPLTEGSELAELGWDELQELTSLVQQAGVPDGNYRIDPSIARGLDYYTGVVFETSLDEDPGIGSICSGGRYDNLAELYTNRQLPGIGASLGLDRLLAAMERLEMIPSVSTPADILIVNFDHQFLGQYLKLAADLRAAGFGVEVYCDNKKAGHQFKYANKKGFTVCLIAGEDEFARQSVQLKWLADGTQVEVSLEDGVELLVSALREGLIAD